MRRRLRWVGYGVGTLIAGLALLSLGERVLWRDKVLPGVRLSGVAVAGRDHDTARRLVAARAAALEGEPFVAVAGDERFTFTPGDVGFDVDERAAYAALRRAGRTGNPATRAVGVLRRRVRPVEIAWEVRYDDEELARAVDAWAARVDGAPEDGTVTLAGVTVVTQPPRHGRTLDRAGARRLVADALADRARGPLVLPVHMQPAAVGTEEVERAAAEARRILDGPATIVVEGRAVPLSAEQLAAMVGIVREGDRLRVELPEAAVHAALRGPLAGVEVPARDARFIVEGEPPVVRIEESALGRELDVAPVAEALRRGDRRVEARLRDAAPRIDTARAHALRIIEPVSTFTTAHPAGQPRVRNIHRIADLLQDTVILPGERFSLNDKVGPRTRQRGFVKAPVIYDGVFTQDFGGGVSQFATTFFNAAFFGGYKIVAHQPHSVYIPRYPQGREATISFPEPDLVIENDSTTGILVRTAYTESSITVTLFGDREGRAVRAEGPRVGRRSRSGYKVEVVRVIERPGQPPERESFRTHYRTGRRRAAPRAPARPPASPPPAVEAAAPPRADSGG